MAAEAKAPLLDGRRGATPAQTLGNIVVSIVGTGVLGLPYAFRTAGWLAGALGVAAAGAATFYCMLLLLDCRDKLREQEEAEENDGNYTYGDLGEKCFGRVGRTALPTTWLSSRSSSPSKRALSLIRSLSSLGHFSLLADACTALAVAAVVTQDAQLLAARGVAGRRALADAGIWWGLPFAFGFAVFCFEGFCMTLALEASMAEHRGKFRGVLLRALAGVTLVYVGFGACGYLAYGEETMDIVTLNLPRTWPTAAVKLALCVALALTFPVMMHPIHEIVEARLLGWLRKRCCGGGGGVGERAAVQASRVAVLAALSAVACFVPAFGAFAAFVGSTVCATLSFVLPALFHLRVVGEAANAWQRAVDWFFLLFGLGFAAHGLYAAAFG
ncbi:hypothetical protein PR202_gb10484 [Eleusine coracana subsp. coracana]|uniref:Amino acid transporter transmembrane domain-containing protein n=1 Tax=Eleusine coracana subsp. coracana TaxID=191504 RepID=A0AAV5EJZ8_ELECO|nr:hypothetical protein PR202_gb10484 [Eleusine coracana subsp. coracana]